MLRPAGGKSHAMITTFWLPPLVKALATALLVVSASAAAEVLGPFWGALIATIPVSAGPAYVFLAMRHGDDFVAASALSSCAANAATGLFLIVYSLLGRRASQVRSLGAAIAAWLAASAIIQLVSWTPTAALLLNLAVYGVGFGLPNRSSGVDPTIAASGRRRWFDLAVRAAAVAVFVSFVVMVSSMLGPNVTGIMAVFPITLISLLVIVRPRIGGSAASRLADTALRPMLGFGVMLLALHLAIKPWGTPTALVLALLVSAVWSAALLVPRLRTRRPVASSRGRHKSIAGTHGGE